MRIVTINARLLHNPRLGITNDGLAVDHRKIVNGVLSASLSQMQERVALEVVAGSAVNAPRKRIIAVLTNLDASLAVAAQFLAHIVQKRSGNTERNRIGRGWD